MQQLGPMLAERRRAAGLHAQRLADVVGISIFRLSRIEHGQTQPRRLEYQKLTSVLEIVENALTEARETVARST